MSSDQPTVPYGYCQCGCGKPVPASKVTRRDRGIVKGGPIRYLRGHQPKRQGRPLDDSCYRIEDRGYKTPCWTWLYGKTASGYGSKTIAGHARRYAHVLMYELHVGPVPAGLDLDHLCRNRDCVNPAHLEPVTRGENLRRGSNTRITASTAAEVKGALGRGEGVTAVARRLRVSYEIVRSIRRGLSWRDIEPCA